MKKLLLGLLFTVSCSGFSFAKNFEKQLDVDRVELKNNSESKTVKKTYVTFNYENGIIVSCTIAIHTIEYDTCGNVENIYKESYEAFGSACA